MKYTVEGFSQKCLIDYGLDEKDALILRYFIDFKDSGKMKMKIINKVPYYWLKGAVLLEQLPILRINNIDVLRRRLKKMTSCGILMHEHVLEGGSYAFYTVGENYENLLAYDNLSEDEDINGKSEEMKAAEEVTEKTEDITEKKEPETEKSQQDSEKSQGSDFLVGAKDYSINKSINDNYSAGDITHAGIQKSQKDVKAEKILPAFKGEEDRVNSQYTKTSALKERKAAEKKSSSGKDKLMIPYDEIVKIFNDLCSSFPKVKVRNKTRDNMIKKMYKNIGVNEIKKVFEMAEQSDYLSGRNGKWMNCSFDWLIKENNYIKVLEGNYNRNSEYKAGLNCETGYYYEQEDSGNYQDSEYHDHNGNYGDESEIIINTELLEDL